MPARPPRGAGRGGELLTLPRRCTHEGINAVNQPSADKIESAFSGNLTWTVSPKRISTVRRLINGPLSKTLPDNALASWARTPIMHRQSMAECARLAQSVVARISKRRHARGTELMLRPPWMVVTHIRRSAEQRAAAHRGFQPNDPVDGAVDHRR